MLAHHHIIIRIIIVDSLGLLLVRLFKLGIDSTKKPESIVNGHAIALGVGKATVVHQEKCMLEEDLFIVRSQAKKRTFRWGTLPPMTLSNGGSQPTPSSQPRAQSCQRAYAGPTSP